MKLLDGKPAGVNQLIGAKHKYPLELYKQGKANHWEPADVSMADDAREWRNNELTENEKLIVKRALGLFSAGESEVNNNIFLTEYRYVTDGAARQYMIRKAMEEAVHNETVAVCCEAFSLDEKEVSEAYKNIKAIKNKSDFLLRNTSEILEDKNFDISTIEGKRKFLTNIFVYYIICEGIFFWSNFVMILSIYKRGLLKGLGTQIKYTIADETLHINFGIWLIKQIIKDYPEIWNKDLQDKFVSLLQEAVDLEIEYAFETIPEPMLGFNAEMFVDFMKFVGNRRLESVDLEFRFNTDKNPFPWVEEIMESKTLTAFFEQRETEYRKSTALKDDLF